MKRNAGIDATGRCDRADGVVATPVRLPKATADDQRQGDAVMTISEKIDYYRSKIGVGTDAVSVAAGDLQDLLSAAEIALAMVAPGATSEVLDCRSGAPCIGGAAFGTVVAGI
jgi:hypothetical protein